MRPRVALPILGLALLLSCEQAAPTAPPVPPVASGFLATSEWQEFVLPREWVLFNQCVGEDLHLLGMIVVQMHTVSTSSETRFLFRAGDYDFQVEGLTTHQIWLPVPGAHITVLQTASGDFLVVEERFTIENQTTGAVMDWPSRITFVTDAAGQVRVDRVEQDACRLHQ